MPTKKVTLDPHRQAHFNHFNALASPHFGVTADVDITEFLAAVRRSPTLRFTPAIVYLITKTALAVESFCWRGRRCQAGDEKAVDVVRHETLRPSWAVPTRASSAFSFCTVPFAADPRVFHDAAEAMTARMRDAPSFADEPGADDYLFLSSFPWASFTSVTHAMPLDEAADYVPRIVWGKYYERDGRHLMPLAVQAHHALVDGSEMGRYYQLIQRDLRRSAEIFSDFLV